VLLALGAGCASPTPPSPSTVSAPTPTPGSAIAGARDSEIRAALDSLQATSSIPIEVSVADGFPTAVRARVPVSGATPEEQGLNYLASNRGLYGLSGPEAGVSLSRVVPEADRQPGVAVFQQTYRGVPVFGGQIAVPLHAGFALGSAGGVRPAREVATEPSVDAQAAISAATGGADARIGGTPQLTVLDMAVLAPRARGLDEKQRRPRLAWVVHVLAPVPEDVLVDALDGTIALRIPRQLDAFGIDVRDFQMAGTSSDFSCIALDLFPAASFADPQWQATVANFSSTYDFFSMRLLRDSYDGDGAQINAFINAAFEDDPNASADHTCDLMQFSPGWVTDDIVTHEFTHFVTKRTAGLVYFGEPGALNESYSDVMAYVHTNDPQLGEAIPAADLGSRAFLRDVSSPGAGRNEYSELKLDAFEDGEFFKDHWYVHSNSAIPNYVAWLIANGGVHPDTNVLVSRTGDIEINGIGIFEMADLYYGVLQLLPSNANFEGQRAITIAVAQARGFDDSDLCVVVNAFAAVGLGDQDADCDGILEPLDADADLVNDRVDNCPDVANSAQEDMDGDGQGDTCDTDLDGDGHPQQPASGLSDNCPYEPNADQSDMNFNGVGAVCDDSEDDDLDNDGVDNDVDNCPNDYNPNYGHGQGDVDNDGAGDACDPDMDADSVSNDDDNCPDDPNGDQADGDGDGVGDACDPCASAADDGVGWGTITYFNDAGEVVTEVVLRVPDADGDGQPDACDADGVSRDAFVDRDIDLRPAGDGASRSDFVVSGREGGEIGLRVSTCGPRCDPQPNECVSVRVDGTDSSTRVAIVDNTGSVQARPGADDPEMEIRPSRGETYDLVFALLGETVGDDVAVVVGSCESGVGPSPSPLPQTPAPGGGLLSADATIDLTVDGVAYDLANGSCRLDAVDGLHIYTVTFFEEDEHYLSVIIDSDQPLTDGSVASGHVFGTLMLQGVMDQNIRYLDVVLRDNLMGGTFTAGGTIQAAEIRGTWTC
jgi:hypothetical protein